MPRSASFWTSLRWSGITEGGPHVIDTSIALRESVYHSGNVVLEASSVRLIVEPYSMLGFSFSVDFQGYIRERNKVVVDARDYNGPVNSLRDVRGDEV